MARLLPIEDARAAVLAAVTALEAEEVGVEHALGRVLAEDVRAGGDVPPFDNSGMDGFAVAAGPAGRRLEITGESRAGVPATGCPAAGEALRISTGAVVPPGTGAVIPVEDVDEQDGHVTLRADAVEGRHIRRAGEDMRAGETVLARGTTLGAAEVGVAVVAGRGAVRVARRPRVGIVGTGDELRPPGAALGPGQIHDSNGVTLAALAAAAGADVIARTTAGDDREETRRTLGRALEDADVVVVSGGVSVGPHDHVKAALDELGVRERFWRVALRPGKPTWFGTRGDTLVFGLPGNPVSSMVTFTLFARPALAALQGADPQAARIAATVTTPMPRHPDRDEAVRVRLDAERRAAPTGPQGSHQLTSMLAADGLALVRAGEGELAPGDAVEVELLERGRAAGQRGASSSM